MNLVQLIKKELKDGMNYSKDEFLNVVENILASIKPEAKHVHPPCRICGEYPCVCEPATDPNQD